MVSSSVERRTVVAVGTSAGGVEALPTLLAQLPADLPAAMLVVMHVAASPRSILVDILRRTSVLPVKWAENDEPIRPGNVYVAPPDVHMLVNGERTVLLGGPKENHARPSINRLFRAVAADYGSRAIGVLLTGMLDDGVAGMISLRRAGGTVVVQQPSDAAFSEMPRNAIQAVAPDHIVPLSSMGALLLELTRTPAPVVAAPSRVEAEAGLDRKRTESADELARLGEATLLSCPDCGGRLWDLGPSEQPSFRCYEGHAMSSATLLAKQSEELEHSLWAAVRSLQERAYTLGRLGEDARRLGNPLTAGDYDSRARESHAQADRARAFVLELQAANARRAVGT